MNYANIARNDEHPDYWAEDCSQQVDDLMEDADTVEAWFCGRGRHTGYDLTNPQAAAELHDAMQADVNTGKPYKFCAQYISDRKESMCEDVADFFFYYGLPRSLCRLIGYDRTPIAYQSLRDFCVEELRAKA